MSELKIFVQKKTFASGHAAEVPESPDAEAIGDEAAEAASDIFAKLTEMREQLQHSEDADTFFRVEPLGGLSTLRLRGAVGHAPGCCSLQVAARYDVTLCSNEGPTDGARMVNAHDVFLSHVLG